MRSLTRLGFLPALLTLLVSGVAVATPIIEPPNPFGSEAPRGGPEPSPRATREERLQVGVHLAQWDFAPLDVPGTRFETIEASLSPLLTLDYHITRDLSLGGWWNPFHGKIEAAAETQFTIADFDARFWDISTTYYLPEKSAPGWSVQMGFSQLHFDLDLVRALREIGIENFGDTTSSFNFWINKAQRVGSRTVHGIPRPITLYGSVGYYTSSQFDHALNGILGGSLPLSRRLTLSSSVWFFDLDDPNVRVTLGLSGRF